MKNRTALPFSKLFTGIIVACVCVSGSAIAFQQMELRKFEQYAQQAFEKSKPAIGETAPEIELKTLDGKPVKLSSYRGKHIVVVKAGYT